MSSAFRLRLYAGLWATLPRVPELPDLRRREPSCPAAMKLAGTSAITQGCICRVMQIDQEDDLGIRMNPRQLEVVRDGEGGVHLNLKSDPSTVVGFCHGYALPVLTDDDDKSLARASYTRCPVWQAEKNRIAEGRDRLTLDPEPESVSMGMDEASHEAADPWAAARRDLDILAPPELLCR